MKQHCCREDQALHENCTVSFMQRLVSYPVSSPARSVVRFTDSLSTPSQTPFKSLVVFRRLPSPSDSHSFHVLRLFHPLSISSAVDPSIWYHSPLLLISSSSIARKFPDTFMQYAWLSFPSLPHGLLLLFETFATCLQRLAWFALLENTTQRFADLACLAPLQVSKDTSAQDRRVAEGAIP